MAFTKNMFSQMRAARKNAPAKATPAPAAAPIPAENGMMKARGAAPDLSRKAPKPVAPAVTPGAPAPMTAAAPKPAVAPAPMAAAAPAAPAPAAVPAPAPALKLPAPRDVPRGDMLARPAMPMPDVSRRGPVPGDAPAAQPMPAAPAPAPAAPARMPVTPHSTAMPKNVPGASISRAVRQNNDM